MRPPTAFVFVLVQCLFCAGSIGADADRVQVLVRVAARDIGRRTSDELPAQYRLAAPEIPANRNIDPATLEVVRWDAEARRPLGQTLPLRWYDDSVPYEFAEAEQNVHSTDGIHQTVEIRPRWGDFYNLLGDGAGGRLVWSHSQQENSPATYAISFRVLPPGQKPARLAPRGFVGDGSHRCAPVGHTTTGTVHARLATADWDHDGLTDLLVGGSQGHVVWYRNIGTKTDWKFSPPRLLLTADGQPLDVGWGAAPLAVDWDGDGVVDLLSGAERNRVLFYRNAGTNREPRLVNRGFITVDDKPLELPVEPVPKSPPGIYVLDYYPVLESADWNGDGRADLLCGGYVTGRVFYYENGGKAADGTPKLVSRGPLEADGQPLNVGDWAAAPCAADFDFDGDLDLMSGNMPLNAGGGDSLDAETILRYYENVGTRTTARLAERPFPREGKFPAVGLATPRAADFNGDGLLDLAVSASENIYIFANVGTKTEPRFAVHNIPLPGEWGSAPLPTFAVQLLDWNGDGRQDILTGLSIHVRTDPDRFQGTSLLPPGNRIEHPAPHGDGWTFTHLADLDGDSRLDILFGTHEGHVWLHRCLGGSPQRFDEHGERLLMQNGQPIQVGPAAGQNLDFDVLQGSRVSIAVADFDADGLLDLVLGDTYGKVRQYRNTGDRNKPRFDEPTLLGDQKIRTVPYAADWDGDGRPDIIASAASGHVAWWRNLGGGKFDAEQKLNVPAVPYSPVAAITDWNGDGDLDLFVGTAYGYTCWFERSFLESGYGVATCLGAPGIQAGYDPLESDKSKPDRQDLTVKDDARSREIPIRLYLPKDKAAAPVVLFSHGLGGSREGSAYLGEHWAARGYVAVFLQHPGSDDSVWKDKPRAERLAAMQKAAGLENFQLRVKDVPAVIDQLERWNKADGHALAGRLDLQRIGMSGHSFGAVTTQAVSGQRFALGRGFTDSRIKAAVVMSPSSPRRGDPKSAFGDVKVPWMLLTGTKDLSVIGDADMKSRLAVFPALPPKGKYELVLNKAEHSAFTDRALPGDSEMRNPNHHRAILAMTTAFWDAYLREDPDARNWLDGEAVQNVLDKEDTWQRK